ncbi:hypothetical protein MMC31_003480 [Peltigera leucophlebia]|nr:hypothetical protein [Peltigera leucophlebia]
MVNTRRIDVHHHYIPPVYAELTKDIYDPVGWPVPEWKPEGSKAILDRHSIKTAILSLTAPGTSLLKGKAAAQLAREVNEYGAKLRDENPSRFGFFAAIPPIIDSDNHSNEGDVLNEIKYALDDLKADGVTLFTRYGPGNVYLGHKDIKPIWKELNERKAVVFVHPTTPVDDSSVSEKQPLPAIDFPHETSRTAVDLIINNRIREYPDVKIILSHAGGTLPYLASRAAYLLHDANFITKSPEEFFEDARTLYYDLAISSNPYTLSLLRQFAPEDHILVGTDYPYAPEATIAANIGWLNEAEAGLSKEEKYKLQRGNALALFPRLRELQEEF